MTKGGGRWDSHSHWTLKQAGRQRDQSHATSRELRVQGQEKALSKGPEVGSRLAVQEMRDQLPRGAEPGTGVGGSWGQRGGIRKKSGLPLKEDPSGC